jgi:hypothetical protein
MRRLRIANLPNFHRDYRLVPGFLKIKDKVMAGKEAGSRIRQLRQTAEATAREDRARAGLGSSKHGRAPVYPVHPSDPYVSHIECRCRQLPVHFSDRSFSNQRGEI